MPVYSVTLFRPNKKVFDKIESLYAETDRYKINEKSYLIADRTLLVDKIAANLGLDGTDKCRLATESEPPEGAVFALRKGFYNGWALKTLWEWIDLKEQTVSSPTTKATGEGDSKKAPESPEITTERRLTRLETQMGVVKWVGITLGAAIAFGLVNKGIPWLLRKVSSSNSLQTTLEWSKNLKDLISKL